MVRPALLLLLVKHKHIMQLLVSIINVYCRIQVICPLAGLFAGDTDLSNVTTSTATLHRRVFSGGGGGGVSSSSTRDQPPKEE